MKPRVNLNNYRICPIDDYFLDFAEIWERDYKERSMFDLWMHVVDHAARVAKAVKRDNPPAIIDDIADTTVWLMSFIAFIDNQSPNEILASVGRVSPSQIIWKKYPGICPVCFDNVIIDTLKLQSESDPLAVLRENKGFLESFIHTNSGDLYHRKCDCLTRVSKDDSRTELRSLLKTELAELRHCYSNLLSASGKQPVSMANFENMFEIIYESSNKLFSLESIMFNLLSEIGETTQAIVNLYTFDESREPYSTGLSVKRQQRLLEKIADIMSWLFAVTIKIRNTYGKIAQSYLETITKNKIMVINLSALSFHDIIWSKYGKTKDGGNWDQLKCPGCQGAPCEYPRDLKINWQTETAVQTNGDEKEAQQNGEVTKDLIFISYSNLDVKWLQLLKDILKPAEKSMKLAIWDDTMMQPGKLWREEIDSALSRAKMAILIVTHHFFTSEFIEKNELPPLLESARAKGTKIYWIPFGASMYHVTEIEKYQSLWPPKQPLDQFNESQLNGAMVEICKEIYNVSIQ